MKTRSKTSIPAALAAALLSLAFPAASQAAPDSLALAYAPGTPQVAPGPRAIAPVIAALPLGLPSRGVALARAVGARAEIATGLDLGDPLAGGGRFEASLPMRAIVGWPAALELGGVRTASEGRDGPRWWSEARLVAGGVRGGWVGLAGQRAAARDESWRPLFGLGGWTHVGGVALGASMSQFGDRVTHRTITRIDSTDIEQRRLESVTRTAARVSARWANRLVEVDAAGGVALAGAAPWRWAEARAVMWPWRRVGVVVSAASRMPLGFDATTTPDRRASLGLTLDPWRAAGARRAEAPAWRVRPARSGRLTVEVRAPGAAAVELMGDVTGWSPVALRRAGAAWRVELAIPPGVHQVAMRIDGGAWRPPPGLPTALDEFGGTVGVLVVE